MCLQYLLSIPAADIGKTCPCPDHSTVAPKSAKKARQRKGVRRLTNWGATMSVVAACSGESWARALAMSRQALAPSLSTPYASEHVSHKAQLGRRCTFTMDVDHHMLHLVALRVEKHRQLAPARPRKHGELDPALYNPKSLVKAHDVQESAEALTWCEIEWRIEDELRNAERPHCKDGGGKKRARPCLTAESMACVRAWPLQPTAECGGCPSPPTSHLTSRCGLRICCQNASTYTHTHARVSERLPIATIHVFD